MRGGCGENDGVGRNGWNDGVQNVSRQTPGWQTPSTAVQRQEFSS
jgi:hypothetical protein